MQEENISPELGIEQETKKPKLFLIVLISLIIVLVFLIFFFISRIPEKEQGNLKIENLKLEYKDEKLADVFLTIKNTGKEEVNTTSIQVSAGKGNSIKWNYEKIIEPGQTIQTNFGGALFLGSNIIIVKINNEEIYSEKIENIETI